jgi:hypothetical protein
MIGNGNTDYFGKKVGGHGIEFMVTSTPKQFCSEKLKTNKSILFN